MLLAKSLPESNIHGHPVQRVSDHHFLLDHSLLRPQEPQMRPVTYQCIKIHFGCQDLVHINPEPLIYSVHPVPDREAGGTRFVNLFSFRRCSGVQQSLVSKLIIAISRILNRSRCDLIQASQASPLIQCQIMFHRPGAPYPQQHSQQLAARVLRER